MQLYTPVELPGNIPDITYNDKLLIMGSCFAESIGSLLVNNKFRCDVNPFGILYNPFSVCKALDQIIGGKIYSQADLFFHQECYHSFMHHSSFSAHNAGDVMKSVNRRIDKAHHDLCNLKYLIVTFGTAWAYSLKDTESVVSNCHKLPGKNFSRRRLSTGEITIAYHKLLNLLFEINPNLTVMFTVSPIRHIKDGIHENQLSKATLLLAIDSLSEAFGEKVVYYPSYEIMLDELRDYRFYADDMLHPSSQAVLYIWECFVKTFFSAETQNIMKECESICKALNHKPFNTASGQYKSFLEQIVLKIERLREKYPNLDLQKEINLCYTRLRGLQS